MLRQQFSERSSSAAGSTSQADGGGSTVGGSSTARKTARSPRSHYAQSTATSLRFKSVSAVLPIASPMNDVKCCSFGSIAFSDAKLRAESLATSSSGRRGTTIASAKSASSLLTPAAIASTVASPHYLMGTDAQPFHLFTAGKHGVVEVRNGLSALPEVAAVPQKGTIPTWEVGKKLGSVAISLCFTPKGHLWVGYADGAVRVYDLTQGPLEDPTPGMSQPLMYMQDDHQGTSRLLLESRKHSGPVNAIVHSHIESSFTSPGSGGSVRSGGSVVGFAAGTRETNSSTQQQAVFTCGADWKIMKWTMNPPFAPLGCVGSHTLAVRALCVTSSCLVSGGDDHQIRLWPFQLLEQKATLEGHTSAVVTLLYHRGILWSGSEDGAVRLWNIDGDRSCIKVLIGHQSHVVSIRPVESLMYTCDKEGSILVWELNEYELVHVFRHTTIASPSVPANVAVGGGAGASASNGSKGKLPAGASGDGKAKGPASGASTPRGVAGKPIRSPGMVTSTKDHALRKKEPAQTAASSNAFYIHDVKIVASVKGSIAWYLTTDGVRLAFLPSHPVEEELERRFGPPLEELEEEENKISAAELDELHQRLETYEMKEQRQYEALQELQEERDEFAIFTEMVTDEFIEYTFKEFFDHYVRMSKLFSSATVSKKDDVMRVNEALQDRLAHYEKLEKDMETKLAERSKLLTAANAKLASSTTVKTDEINKLRLENGKLSADLKQSKFELRTMKEAVERLETSAANSKQMRVDTTNKSHDERIQLRADLQKAKLELETVKAENSKLKEPKIPAALTLSKPIPADIKGLKARVIECETELAAMRNDLQSVVNEKRRLEELVVPKAEETGRVDLPALTPDFVAKDDAALKEKLEKWLQTQKEKAESERKEKGQLTGVVGEGQEEESTLDAFTAVDALVALYRIEALRVATPAPSSSGSPSGKLSVSQKEALAERDSQIAKLREEVVAKDMRFTELKAKADAERARVKQLQEALSSLKQKVESRSTGGVTKAGSASQSISPTGTPLAQAISTPPPGYSKSTPGELNLLGRPHPPPPAGAIASSSTGARTPTFADNSSFHLDKPVLYDDPLRRTPGGGGESEQETLTLQRIGEVNEKDRQIELLRVQLALAQQNQSVKDRQLLEQRKLTQTYAEQVSALQPELPEERKPQAAAEEPQRREDDMSSLQLLSRELGLTKEEGGEDDRATQEEKIRMSPEDRSKVYRAGTGSGSPTRSGSPNFPTSAASRNAQRVKQLAKLEAQRRAHEEALHEAGGGVQITGDLAGLEPKLRNELVQSLSYAGIADAEAVADLVQHVSKLDAKKKLSSPSNSTPKRSDAFPYHSSEPYSISLRDESNTWWDASRGEEDEDQGGNDGIFGDGGQAEKLNRMVRYLNAVKDKLLVLEKAANSAPSPILRDGALMEIYRLHIAMQEKIEEQGLKPQLGGMVDPTRFSSMAPDLDVLRAGDEAIRKHGVRVVPQPTSTVPAPNGQSPQPRAKVAATSGSLRISPSAGRTVSPGRLGQGQGRSRDPSPNDWYPRRHIVTGKPDPNKFVKRGSRTPSPGTRASANPQEAASASPQPQKQADFNIREFGGKFMVPISAGFVAEVKSELVSKGKQFFME